MSTFPLFLSGELFKSQDILFHLTWAEQFYSALQDGTFYPRWVDTPFGYGSATFIFYAPLSFYLLSGINFFANSFVMSLKLAIFISFFLSGISMYLFMKGVNAEKIGVASAIIYQIIPYHTFNLFTRGVLPELFAFIWFPLILLTIRNMFLYKKPISIVYAGLPYAGLILTHLVSAFMFTFVMLGYGLYLTFIEKKSGILKLPFGMLVGLGLSSIYLIPVVFERTFVHIEFIKFFNYTDCFLFLKDTLLDREFYPILHAIFIMESAFFIFTISLVRRKIIDIKYGYFIILLFASLFLSIPLSSLIWKYVPEFSNLQFPWRWLMFSGLSLSILSGLIIETHEGEIRKAILIIFFPLLLLSLLNMSHISFFKNDEIKYWTGASVLFAPIEYRPIWLNQHRKNLPPLEKITIVKGEGTADITEWKAHKRTILAKGEAELILQFSTFYFPGWKAYLDGTEIAIQIENETGAMLLDIPEGEHMLELKFVDTPVRYYGKLISLLSLAALGGFLLREKMRKSPKLKTQRNT
jgi:hypothetical protein